MNGFEHASTETLTVVRDNLLGGLERVAEALADGTFTTVSGHGEAPPSQSGQTTLMLLTGVQAELDRRAADLHHERSTT